ncbi:Myelin-associated oligodendrocyte basic protein [Lemmus lemmus]
MSQKMAKEGPRLSKNQKFSEHFSIHCCPPFTFLNSKREIVDRKYSICKSGCFYQKKEEDWICCACQKTRPPCQVPSEAQAPASCVPRGGQSAASQAKVPSEASQAKVPFEN